MIKYDIILVVFLLNTQIESKMLIQTDLLIHVDKSLLYSTMLAVKMMTSSSDYDVSSFQECVRVPSLQPRPH